MVHSCLLSSYFRTSFDSQEIVNIAFLVLFKLILTSGDSTRRLMDSIVSIDADEIVRIFTGVIRLGLEYAVSGIPTEMDFMVPHYVHSQTGGPNLYLQYSITTIHSMEYLFRGTSNVKIAVFNVPKSCTAAADRHPSVRVGQLWAGRSLRLSSYLTMSNTGFPA